MNCYVPSPVALIREGRDGAMALEFWLTSIWPTCHALYSSIVLKYIHNYLCFRMFLFLECLNLKAICTMQFARILKQLLLMMS